MTDDDLYGTTLTSSRGKDAMFMCMCWACALEVTHFPEEDENEIYLSLWHHDGCYPAANTLVQSVIGFVEDIWNGIKKKRFTLFSAIGSQFHYGGYISRYTRAAKILKTGLPDLDSVDLFWKTAGDLGQHLVDVAAKKGFHLQDNIFCVLTDENYYVLSADEDSSACVVLSPDKECHDVCLTLLPLVDRTNVKSPRNRINYAWRVITQGYAPQSSITLSLQDAAGLGHYLIKLSEAIK